MKKKTLFLLPVVFSMLLASCGAQTPSEPPEPVDFEGVTFADSSYVYDGLPHILAEVSGAPEDTNVTYTGREEHTDVGEYQATATLVKEGYNDLTLTATLTITKATLSNASFDSLSLTYDGEEHALEVSGLPAGSSVVYTSDVEGVTNAATDVGEYNITANISNPNYNDLTLTATLTIVKATFGEDVEFKGKTFEYDAEPHSIEVTGLPETATVTYSSDVEGITNSAIEVGEYNITATITDPNYEDLELTAKIAIEYGEDYCEKFDHILEHGVCKVCRELVNSEKIIDYAVTGTTVNEEEVAPKGFTNVYSRDGLSNGNVGADIDVSGYKSLYFALRHDASYAYIFGGAKDTNENTLWQDDWYYVLIEKVEGSWTAYVKKTSDEEWYARSVDGKTDTNLSSILRLYNWENEFSNVTLCCTEVYATMHDHVADEDGFCTICNSLVGANKISDIAIKNASATTDRTAPSGFKTVSKVHGVSNGNVGASVDISNYTKLYFALAHTESYAIIFGGGKVEDGYARLWANDWYYIMLEKVDGQWQGYVKNAANATSWSTATVDGKTDTNLSSLLKLYKWEDDKLTKADVYCTEVYAL